MKTFVPPQRAYKDGGLSQTEESMSQPFGDLIGYTMCRVVSVRTLICQDKSGDFPDDVETRRLKPKASSEGLKEACQVLNREFELKYSATPRGRGPVDRNN